MTLVRIRMGQRLTGLYWSQLHGRMWKSSRARRDEGIRQGLREVLRRFPVGLGVPADRTADCEREIEAMGAVAEQFERLPAFARQLRLIENRLRHPDRFSKGLWRKDPKL